MRFRVQSLASLSGVGRRCGSDPVWLWLWCRPAATAPIRPLAWEPPYASGVAPEKTKKKKKFSVDYSIISHIYIVQQISTTFSFCMTGTLCPLNSNSSHFPFPPGPGDHHSFCFYDFDYTRYLIKVELCSLYPSVTGIFLLA